MIPKVIEILKICLPSFFLLPNIAVIIEPMLNPTNQYLCEKLRISTIPKSARVFPSEDK